MVNNLTATSSGYALDARQGKTLNDNINTMNSRIGKTALFHAGTDVFYVPANSTYNGLATGIALWNDITGLSFVGDGTNYRHYYTFPSGTYVVSIGMFIETDITSDIAIALKISIDDTELYNPWFRLHHQYHSMQYTCIVKGSKLCVLMHTSLNIGIHPSVPHTFISFMRIG